MPPNEPAPTAPFTDEDRTEVARVQCALDTYGEQNMASYQLLILRLASHIDHLEDALMAAAWPIHAMGDDHPDMPEWAREPTKWLRGLQARIDDLERALREIADHPDDLSCDGNCEEHMVEIARAALRTSEDGDAG